MWEKKGNSNTSVNDIVMIDKLGASLWKKTDFVACEPQRRRDLIFTTDLQTVNYYSTIHCWSWSISSILSKQPIKISVGAKSTHVNLSEQIQ